MFHRQINAEKMFEQARESKQDLAPSSFDNDTLINKFLSILETDEEKSTIAEQVPIHLCETYEHKDLLRTELSIIARVLTSPDEMQAQGLNDNERRILLLGLFEDVDLCTPGFMDRTQNALLLLNNPQSIEELLTHYRTMLVEAAFTRDELRASTHREIHTRNRFFVLANAMGLCVPCVQDDPHHGLKADIEIIAAIKYQFIKQYTPLEITKFLMMRILNPLKEQKEPKELEEQYDKSFEFFKKILKNPTLTRYDMYRVNVDGQILMPDPIKIQSQLIHFLYTENYFHPFTPESMQWIEAFDGLIKIYFDGVDLRHAIIEFTLLEKKYLNYLLTANDLLVALPTDIKSELAEKLIHLLTEPNTDRSLIIAYLHQVNILFSGNIPTPLLNLAQALFRNTVRNVKEMEEAFELITTHQLTSLFNHFDAENVLARFIQFTIPMSLFLDCCPPESLAELIHLPFLKKIITHSLKSPYFLRELFKTFRSQQAITILDLDYVKNRLVARISSWEIFRENIEFISIRNFKLFLAHKICRIIFRNLMENANDVEWMLSEFDGRQLQCILKLHYVQLILVERISQASDLQKIFKLATKSVSFRIFDIFKEVIPNMVIDANSLYTILSYCPFNRRSHVLNQIADGSAKIITSYNDIKTLLQCDLPKASLRLLIAKQCDFFSLFKGCPFKQKLRLLKRVFPLNETLITNFKAEYAYLESVKTGHFTFFQRPDFLLTIMDKAGANKAPFVLLNYIATHPQSKAAQTLTGVFDRFITPRDDDIIYYSNPFHFGLNFSFN